MTTTGLGTTAMIRSMTSYASTEGECDGRTLVWELRAVNHRFLDIVLKIPEPLRFVEMDARNRIAARLRRGRIECSLACKHVSGTSTGIRLNSHLIQALLAAVEEVENRSSRALASFHAFDVLRWPGVIEDADADRVKIGAGALAILDCLLDQAVAMRGAEGSALSAMMIERLERIERYIVFLKQRVPEIRHTQRQKLLSKLAEVSAGPNTERLEQELVYWAQRMDVAEELDRLEAHLGEFRKALAQPEATGRRLDFLLQEMNREANTLASKSSETPTTAAAVEIKVLIEQLREQVQNIE